MKCTFKTEAQAKRAANTVLRTLAPGWTPLVQSCDAISHWTITLRKRLRPTDKQEALLILATNGWHFWHPTTSRLGGGTIISVEFERGQKTPVAAIRHAHRKARRAVNGLIRDLNLIKAEDAL